MATLADVGDRVEAPATGREPRRSGRVLATWVGRRGRVYVAVDEDGITRVGLAGGRITRAGTLV